MGHPGWGRPDENRCRHDCPTGRETHHPRQRVPGPASHTGAGHRTGGHRPGHRQPRHTDASHQNDGRRPDHRDRGPASPDPCNRRPGRWPGPGRVRRTGACCHRAHHGHCPGHGTSHGPQHRNGARHRDHGPVRPHHLGRGQVRHTGAHRHRARPGRRTNPGLRRHSGARRRDHGPAHHDRPTGHGRARHTAAGRRWSRRDRGTFRPSASPDHSAGRRGSSRRRGDRRSPAGPLPGVAHRDGRHRAGHLLKSLVTSENRPAGRRRRLAARRCARTGCRRHPANPRPAPLPHHGNHRRGCTGCRRLANRLTPAFPSASRQSRRGSRRRDRTGCRCPANRRNPSRYGSHSHDPCCGRHRRSRQKNHQNRRSGRRPHRTTAHCDAGDRHPIPFPAGHTRIANCRSGKMRQAHARRRRIRGRLTSWTRRRLLSHASTSQPGAHHCQKAGWSTQSRRTQSRPDQHGRPGRHGHTRHQADGHPLPTAPASLPNCPLPHRHGKLLSPNHARPRHRPTAAEDHQPRMGRRGPARCRHCHDCSRPLCSSLTPEDYALPASAASAAGPDRTAEHARRWTAQHALRAATCAVAALSERCPAASYSPTQSPAQYHRR